MLARCLRDKIRIVGNFGAANPRGAAERILAMAREQGLARAEDRGRRRRRSDRVAVGGENSLRARPAARSCAVRREIIAANLYLGAEPIAQALDQGADIVVTGRVADSALALGPLIHAFRWKLDDWDRLAAGTLAGHLLECGSQITGGYFADPSFKDVPGMADLGYPIAEIDADGGMVITKPAGTGGRVDRLTVIEQLLYEIHDPSAYLAPDVVLDVTDVDGRGDRARPRACHRRARQARAGNAESDRLRRWRHAGRSRDFLRRTERRRARAARRRDHRRAHEQARARPASSAPTLSAWSACLATTAAHCRGRGPPIRPTSGCASPRNRRIAAEVELLLDEVEALYCAGPAGGAGVRRRLTPRLASASCLIERKFAQPRVTMHRRSAHDARRPSRCTTSPMRAPATRAIG